jgi:outer membrane autotransporter protein
MRRKQGKISKRSARKALGVDSTSIGALFLVAALVSATHAVAGTWVAPFSNNNWNDQVNWSDFTVPDTPGETATFSNLSNQLSPTVSANVLIESITFIPGANSYSIETNGFQLTLEGAGIVNNSGTTQTITNNGSTVSGAPGGVTEFSNASTAGNAAITNSGGTVSGSAGGSTVFNDTSTAGNATIVNNSGVGQGGFAFTSFNGQSNGGNATITNAGATASDELGGLTTFNNESTGGNATIVNNGSTVSGAVGDPDGLTVFSNTSTAGSAKIVNNGATVSGGNGGVTLFFDTTNAGRATIINNGGTGGGMGGITRFFDSSDGGIARAITNGNGSFDISGLTTAGMGIGSIEGSGNYFLGSKTLTVGGNNLSTTVSGVIQDGGNSGGVGGSLTKIGTGTLTLTGTNTYTGVTTVNAGSLILDGAIASVQTLVNTRALLGGRGSLGGNLVNSGIVNPGDSPGTLTVGGNYTQNAAGTLRIEIAGLAASQHDLLAVNGHAGLAGTLQLVGLGGFTLHVGDQLTFLTANGGVSGSFGTVQNDFTTGTIVKAQVVTLSNAVALEGTQGSFVQAACNPNSAAVAEALDRAVGDPRASTLIAFLDGQPFNNLCGDFTLIAPEALASIFNAGVSLANVQTANLQRRMEDVRAGSNGFSSSGFTLNGGAPSFSGGLAGGTGSEGKSGPSVMAPTPENRWGVWVTGIGEFTNVDGSNGAAGYDIHSGGVTFGVDYRVCSIFAIGLTAGYTNINGGLANGGDLDVNAGQLGLYATLFGGGFYADAAVTGGPSGYHTRRTALLGSASGSTVGGNLNTLIAAGYDWKKGGLSIGPTADFQYSYFGLSGFTESGSLAPLKIDSQNAQSERTALGMKASYEWKVGHVIVKPEISAAWQHEFGDQAYSIVASFANGAGNSFTVTSPQIGRDSLLIGAGATVLLSDRISVYAFYDGELLRTNYESNNLSAGVRMTF